jgi:hypothetical protein
MAEANPPIDPEVENVDKKTGEVVSMAGTGRELAAAGVASEREAVVKAKFAMAQHRPRDFDAVRIALLKSCKRPLFAEGAEYEKPVGGGKKARGASIRFAEEALRCLGNIDVQMQTIYEDDEIQKIRVDVIDLESNASISTEHMLRKVVERKQLKKGQEAISSRINSYGERVYLVQATDDDMLNKTNAAVSKGMRNGVMRLCPSDLAEEALEQCRATKRDRDAKDPEGARKRLIDGFADLGVSPESLKAHVGQDLGSLSPAQIGELRNLYRALNDGETTWQQVLDESKEGGEKAAPKSRSSRARGAAKSGNG